MSRRTSPWRDRFTAAGGLLTLTIAGCAVGPDFHRPAAPALSHYLEGADPAAAAAARGTAQHFTAGPLQEDWWRLFGSERLDSVLAEAFANNPGLEAAAANLRANQDELRSGYGIFYPRLDAGAAATRGRYAVDTSGGFTSSVFNLFTLGTSVSYALDLFGGQRRLIEGLRSEVEVARAEDQAAHLTLAANVVNTVIASAAYRAEVEATAELVALQKEQVHIAEVQYRSGTAPYSTVLSLRGQLADDEAGIPQLEQKLSQSDHLLASLAGRVPAEWTAPAVPLEDLNLPEQVPLTLPSELVRQRPDIVAAEATAHSASANLGVATAALLPSVTLSGSLQAASHSAQSLFPPAGRTWNVGAQAAAPLFQGGSLWFKRRAAADRYRQAMALYRQTVIGAFVQVADSLRALEYDARSLAAEDESLAAASEALRLIQANYRAGLATYLDVLSADAQFHQARIGDIQAVALRYQDTVALFAALGGGWWNPAARTR